MLGASYEQWHLCIANLLELYTAMQRGNKPPHCMGILVIKGELFLYYHRVGRLCM